MCHLIDDYLTVGFWSITYLLIVFAGYRSRKIKRVSMPYIAGILNFAWEICAMYRISGFWGYILWFAIDLAIVCFGFYFLDSKSKRISYLIAIIVSTIGLFIVFDKFTDGFAYSVYIIDLLMAICFLVERKKLSPVLQITIAITRLFGDFFAGFVFRYLTFTVVIAVVVFVCNCVYLCLCIKEKRISSSGGFLSKPKPIDQAKEDC